ncbi:FAD-dependent oxidoreductase [Cellulomonas fengjieae]|uniref:FAD-dependent oxidoreductase n=1 Tax=Cellulomonas fengjieae TaxID=2819978 RepID=UPI0027DB7D51|nr:FAD-dependent oxidoreductase [Cellulomonas fengjieae]
MSKRIEQSFDVVVAGGGLAGVCAAIAAARGGAKTCLVHERPVLGGVASSEMRVTVHGAAHNHAFARETGIISEMLSEERRRNHEDINENGWTNSVFDQVLYDWCQREPNLTLHLNTTVLAVRMEGGGQAEVEPHTERGYYLREACAPSRRIEALVARTLSAEVDLVLEAPLFVDCTGDAVVADRAGCEWRMGSESRDEHDEPHASVTASTATMGSSIHIRAKDVGRDAPFTAPPWAVRHDDASYFYDQGRVPSDPRGGYWWIEIGVPWHTIFDNETIRHELTRHALGVWDWMKNRDPLTMERCRTYALDFVGQVPGKRESRRVRGRHWIVESDLQERRSFPDAVAHGGWGVDLHTPGGLLAATSEPAAAENYREDSRYAGKTYLKPYGIPLRALMARDVDNLFLAGRCISTTRAALGSVRVMGTTAVMGQAVGTAAAMLRRRGMTLPDLADDAAAGGPATGELQQRLVRDGVYLPDVRNSDPGDLARTASVTASSTQPSVGLSPQDHAPFEGLIGVPPRDRFDLDVTLGQHVWCSGRLDRVELCLDNDLAEPVQVPVRLVRVEGIWDNRKGGSEVLAEAALTAGPGASRWVAWDVDQQIAPGWLRIETVEPAPGVAWRAARGVLPGHFGVRHLSATHWRDVHGSFAFRLSPEQAAFEPAEVLSGTARPQASPSTWRSDPGRGLPQWLELTWPQEQRVGRVELTFPGTLLKDVHGTPPFYVEPQTARDYVVEADGVEVLRVTGNTSWRRSHELDRPVDARALRVLVLATNGDPAASLVEVRCYAL